MKPQLKLVWGCVTSVLFWANAKSAFLTEEHTLFTHLLNGYNTNIRPTFRPIDTVNVTVDIALTQIIEFNVRNQQLETNVWMRQYWVDAHMKWNSSQYGGVEEISVSSDLVWTPDITLYNDVSSEKDGGNYMGDFDVKVNSDGEIKWLAPIVTTSSCTLDVTYFPWDIQHCHLQYGSWIYDSGSIDLTNATTEVDLRYYIDHGEWDLIRTNVRVQIDTYPCCVHDFPTLFFELTLKRKPLYYVMNLITPCVFITLTALLSFCLPPDSGEKISLAVTILLATTVFLLLVNESMPVQSVVVPYIAQYFMAVLGILSVSTCMSVHVLSIHHNGGQGQRVSRWVKIVCFRGIGPALGLGGRLARHSKEHGGLTAGKSAKNGNKVAEAKVVTNGDVKDNISEIDIRNEPHFGHNELSSLYKIRNSVDNIKDFIQEQKEEENLKSEWIMLAVILDRLYFVLALILIVICCTALLIHRPSEGS